MIQAALGKLKGDGLGARALRGSLLTLVKMSGSTLIRLASSLLLTRLLFPEAFGLMALVHSMRAGLKLFSDIGISASVIQHKRGDDPTFLHAAWTLQIIRGFLLYLMVVIAAPYVADFYQEPVLAPLMYLTGLAAVIRGFTPARVMSASRNLQLERLTWIGLIVHVLTAVITVALAWALQSVWALAIGIIAGSLVRLAMLYRFMPGIRDRLCFEWAAMRDLIGFGIFVLIGSAAAFAVNHGDKLILGKFITLEDLGVYAIALTLAMLPVTVGRGLANRIVFPLYSRRPPQESPRNRKNLSKARFTLSAALFGIATVLILFSNPLILFLYDARYAAAGAICVLVVLGLTPIMLTVSYDKALLSNGRSDLHALSTVINGLLRLGALYLGISQFGIVGAALAPLASTVLHYPILVSLIHRYKAWDPRHDLVFALMICVLAALCWWVNAEAIRAVPGFPEGL